MKIKKRLVRLLPFLMAGGLILTTSCNKGESQKPLRIAVATNVKFAIDDITKAFTKETGIPVDISTGSSGKLTAQIESGAPFHLFLSANMKYPEKLLASKFAAGEIEVYAMGALSVCTSTESVAIDSWKTLLTESSVKKIGIANPENAPYGLQSVKALEALGIYDAIKPKIVTAENVAQALQYAITEGAELSFTAKSITLAPEMRGKVKCVDVDRGLYSPIKQGAVILALGEKEQKKSAKSFYDFLKTEKAKKIFEEFGYVFP